MRIGVNIFIALMISVMGVLYQPIIEKPVSIYYDSEVTHTSSHYSYKPGQSGTEYRFFIKQNDSFRELNFLETIGLPTVFYLFFVTLIGIFRKLIFSFRKSNSKENRYSGPVIVQKANNRLSKSKGYISGIVVLVLTALFYSLGSYGFWRINKPLSTTSSESQYHFTTDQLAFDIHSTENEIWAIDLNDKGVGSLIDLNQIDYTDKMIYYINTVNPNTKEITEIDSFTIKGEYYSFTTYLHANKLWLMARPNFLRVYNTSTHELIYPDISSFVSEYEVLKPGIDSYYPVYSDPDRLYINLMDGSRYYYSLEEDTVVENIKRQYDKISPPYFKMKTENGSRKQLYVVDKNYSSKEIEDKLFTDGSILYQDKQICVVQHFKNITDTAAVILSAFDDGGSFLWKKEQSNLPYIPNKKDIIPNRPEIRCSAKDDKIILTFYYENNSTGICAINKMSGQFLWTFTNKDIDEILNQKKS